MSFADPQTVTIAGVTTSLPRVSVGPNGSKYSSNDGLISISAAHQNGRRTRQTIRLDHAKIAADPLVTTVNNKYSMSAYLVIDRPDVGYTNAQGLDVVTGLVTQFTASSYALITKLLGNES